jgi:uncharacterized protein YjbI with pentapeptide repeats
LWSAATRTVIGALLSVSTILFVCAIATIPGEWQEDHLPAKSALGFLRNHLFAGEVDPTTRRRLSLFSNTLVLPGFDIYEALRIDDPKKVEWKQHSIDLRGRDLRGAVVGYAVLTKADLTGAHLQGASFLEAQLQGASLLGAHLQGASLDQAQLQGASLDHAELQGASLDRAQLQGASLDYAQLQGVWLREAQLQGASLDRAQLQGAWLTGAFLWRARLQLSPSGWKDVFAGSLNWGPEQAKPFVLEPQAWTDATYADLRQSIERIVLEGRMRDDALKRVAILDCSRKDDTLASCDPSAESPNEIIQLRNMIDKASVDQVAYARALAVILGDLVCSKEPDRIWVLRGLLRSNRFRETGSEMPGLANRIMSAGCTVSTALGKADKQKIAAAAAAISRAAPP